jgi:DegV family protein with EDD domain
MPKIKIVTDSTAFLEEEVLERYGIEVVPLYVNFADETIKDGSIDNATYFHKLMHSAEVPTTSQPSAGDFARVFERLINSDHEVVAILISSGISGTVESARAAAKMIAPARISVVDSLSTAGGLALLVLAAARAAQEGKDREEIRALLADLKGRLKVFFVPASLKFLKKGGRIGGAQALLGTLLQIKPLLYFSGGKIEVFDRVRTMKKALARLVNELPATSEGLELFLMNAESGANIQRLKELILQRLPGLPIKTYEISPVIATHVGPVAGLAFIRQTQNTVPGV